MFFKSLEKLDSIYKCFDLEDVGDTTKQTKSTGFLSADPYSIGFDNKTWTQEYEYSDTSIIQFICLDASTYDTLWTKRYITEWLPELYDSYEIEFGVDSINFIILINYFM